MKKILLFLILLFTTLTAALAEPGYISWSQLDPHFGFVRKSPCQSSVGDNCGSEPATWHITPQQCGYVFSTSSARDEQFTTGSFLIGTGTQTDYAFNFPFLDATHLRVKVAGVTKTLGVDYTVTAPANSGTVTFTVAPAALATVQVAVQTTWNGDGATVAFPFHFPVKYINSLIVKVGGVTKAYTTDYTITGLGSASGGTVTFVAAPAAGTDNVSIAFPTTGTTRGNRFTFPTGAEFDLAGYTPSGASPLSGAANRQGQCELSFVVAAPTPANFLEVGFPSDAVRGVDKLTNLPDGASFDSSSGFVRVPHGWGILRWKYNGVSFLYDGNASVGDRLGMASPHTHGQGRLFPVTADPPWWTAGTLVGNLAWCPVGGRGITANANDHPTLLLTPVNCSYLVPSGSSTNYAQAKSVNGIQGSNISAGAAYIAGQAPNGYFYPAGTYPKVSLSGTDGGAIATGDTLTIWNMPSTLGSTINGKWIIKVTAATLKCDGITAGACVELHEEVWDHDATISGGIGIGPPANFVPGDTLSDADGTNRPCCTTVALQSASTASGRLSDPVNGIDLNGALQESAVVGLFKSVAGVVTTAGTKQNLAGMFNPVERRCSFSPSVDKNIVSAVDVEVDNTTNCEFAYMNGTSGSAIARGDTGRRVRYQVAATVSSNVAGGGCQLNIIFDAGAAEEAASPILLNPAGVAGGKYNISFAGNKSGLTEGIHTGKLVAKAVGGGTCTIYSAGTTTSFWIWQ